ncbi:MAG: hypothetical protein AAF569_04135 [Pseudomonadota bacterium]
MEMQNLFKDAQQAQLACIAEFQKLREAAQKDFLHAAVSFPHYFLPTFEDPEALLDFLNQGLRKQSQKPDTVLCRFFNISRLPIVLETGTDRTPESDIHGGPMDMPGCRSWARAAKVGAEEIVHAAPLTDIPRLVREKLVTLDMGLILYHSLALARVPKEFYAFEHDFTFLTDARKATISVMSDKATCKFS